MAQELERFYYKSKNGKGYLNLKTPLSKEEAKNYIEITKEQFDKETYIAPHQATPEEIARSEKVARINALKQQLKDTDYCIIKIAEGVATMEEYADVISSRQSWRAKINQLEEELK